jgi:hypothetical protein
MNICIELAPIDASAPKFFGFSEFLTSLALMVLAWTTSDVRYRFRIDCAPIPLKGITFWVVVIFGTLTLLTDLWRAEQWFVLTSIPLTIGSWQALMGGALLLTYFLWVWFSFLAPATYGKKNPDKFYQNLYVRVINGSQNELTTMAQEITYSIESIIRYAKNAPNEENKKEYKVAVFANRILLLIAEKKFCQAIINGSNTTALVIVEEIRRTKKYDIPISLFINNFVCESIENKNSFLYKETNMIDSGIIGYDKPLSQALFSNYEMAKEIETTLTLRPLENHKWDNDQWKAYLRIVSITLEGFKPEIHGSSSKVISRALWRITRSTNNIHTLNSEQTYSDENEQFERVKLVTKFIKDCINDLSKKNTPANTSPHIDTEDGTRNTDIYEQISRLMLGLILDVSRITNPKWIEKLEGEIISQKIFFYAPNRNKVEKIIHGKFIRLFYINVEASKSTSLNQPVMMTRFLLDLTALIELARDEDMMKSNSHRLAVRWIKNNYSLIHKNNREIAELCLGENMIYDKENCRIVKTYYHPLTARQQKVFLKVNPTSQSAL